MNVAGEHFAQQTLTGVGAHRGRAALDPDIAVEGGIRRDLHAVRQTHAADDGTRTADAQRGVERLGGTDAFEHGIGTGAGEFHDARDRRVITLGDDVGSAEFAGDGGTVLVAAHGDDASGAQQFRRQHTAQAHRAIAEYDGGVSGLDFGADSRMVAGAHHVGEGQQIGEHLVGEVLRAGRRTGNIAGSERLGHVDDGSVGMRDMQVFALAAFAFCTTKIAAVQAAGLESSLARRAFAATDGERHDDEIARFGDGHIGADFSHDADGFMTNRRSGGVSILAAVWPQIGPAHAGAHDADNQVVRVLDSRNRTFFDTHIARAVIDG